VDLYLLGTDFSSEGMLYEGDTKFRLKAQFRLYKLLPDGYIDEVNDRFAKKYGDIITNLREEQTIFQITHIDFLKRGIRRGAIVLPLKEYCPWYNEQISRNFEGEDFDAYMRKLKKKIVRQEAVIQLLIDEFGDDLLGNLLKNSILSFYEILNGVILIALSLLKLMEIIKLRYQKQISNIISILEGFHFKMIKFDH